MGDMGKVWLASGYAYDPTTNDWTILTEYVARDKMEAMGWVKFNRSWMKGLKVSEKKVAEA